MLERILVVDDDANFRKLMVTILEGEGYAVEPAGTVAEAVEHCRRTQFHAVVTDVRLPDGDGVQLLRWIKELMPSTPVIMITAFGTVASAVEAMKIGAVDYLSKPLGSPDELRLAVRNALEQNSLSQERELLRQEQEERFACGEMIAGHPAMRRVLEMVRKVAPTNATVLVTGESGTGKEIIARCIHNNSPRAGRAFVAVNCAALAPSLIESELFGHEKGAFTGAVAQRAGRFERAHGGTLFLDEVGELDAALQAKLLRVLQEKTFERVGGTRQITVDVRLIAATNRNLKQMVEEGKFRDDLYYRLNVFPIEVPPLRDRASDIIPLARYFLDRAARSLGKPGLRLSPEAEQALLRYCWPGNVRELENLMERMAILSEGVVEAEALPLQSSSAAHPAGMKEIERQAILNALESAGGNRTKAAAALGISLRTLQYRLKEYGITGSMKSDDSSGG